MYDIPALLRMLKDTNPDKRYEACELLRVAPSIPAEAMAALFESTHDSNLEVADAAKRALAIHSPQTKQSDLEVSPPPSYTPPSNPPTTQPAIAVSSAPAYSAPQMPMSSPNAPEYIFALERRLMIAEIELSHLRDIVQSGNNQISRESKLPNTAIISPNFLSRAFAVWGHLFVAQLIITIPFWVISFLIAISTSSR
jgi:hypothetical protein